MVQTYINNTIGIQDPVVLVSGTELTFDDTYFEEYNIELSAGQVLYAEAGTVRINESGLLAGTSVKLSGKITQRDSSNTFDDTLGDGHFWFGVNASDIVTVYIDPSTSVSVSDSMKVKVSSDGTFENTFTLTNDYTKFKIIPNGIKHDVTGDTPSPGVRISDLKLETA